MLLLLCCICTFWYALFLNNYFNSSESDGLSALFFFSIANVNSVGEHGWVSTLYTCDDVKSSLEYMCLDHSIL